MNHFTIANIGNWCKCETKSITNKNKLKLTEGAKLIKNVHLILIPQVLCVHKGLRICFINTQ